MDERNIDKTHIIALQDVNGLLRNMELPIPRPEQFIAELQAMIDNPNRSVWDMQSLFTNLFQKSNAYLDYIHPHSYNSSYVGGIRYPKMFGYDELRKSWNEVGCSSKEAYLTSCKAKGYISGTAIANEEEKKAIKNLKKYQKLNFFREAMRWIDASCYNEAVSKLNREGSVKMYSKENIGWSNFTHQINDDIKIAVKTNFGFGRASYFLMAVQYKGIDILPYSYIVKYYKANMADIVRCTRSFSPRRESWSASFDFISDFVNDSIMNPEEFVKSHIISEVTEMMQGLEAIAINPKSYIERIGNKKADPCIINVRPMFRDDQIRMQSYPDETPILFKVEKIVGALDFLTSLTAIAKEVNSIQPHIDRLLELNLSLYPEVQEAVTKINGKVEGLTSINSKLETQIAVLSKKLTPFEEEISRLRHEATSEHPFSIGDYEVTHAEYVKIKKQKNDLQSNLYETNRHINDFNSFLNILNRSLLKLDEIIKPKKAA